jgi:ABC-2 type transport system permease protein
MSKTLALARRELASHFLSPLAYVVGSVFLVVVGLLFFWGFPPFVRPVFVSGAEASLRLLFDNLAYIMVFIAPLLTMRLLSEEFRNGTIETLMTSPISDTQIVLGKFLGVMGLYLAMLATTLVFLALVARYGQPDAGVAAMGYLGMVLLGAAFIAVGMFASALTRYQLVAALVGIAILATFAMLMSIPVAHAPEPLSQLAARLSAMTYFRDFSRGFLDTRGVVYFASACVFFLFLSVKTLESRRWR